MAEQRQIDGKLADFCLTTRVNADTLKGVGIGSPLS